MDTARLKNKKLWLAITLVLILLITVLGAKPAWYAVQDLTFAWTERTETEWKVKAFAEENGLFYAQYPKSLIRLLENNPETEEFVLQYPLRQETQPDLSGFDRETGVPLFVILGQKALHLILLEAGLSGVMPMVASFSPSIAKAQASESVRWNMAVYWMR